MAESDAAVSGAVPTEEVGERMETLFLSCEAPVREEVDEQMETLLSCEAPDRALENAEPKEGVVGSYIPSAEELELLVKLCAGLPSGRRVELALLQKLCASEEEYETARTRSTWTEVDCTSSGSEDGASFVDEECLRQNRLHFQRLVDTSPRNPSIAGRVARKSIPIVGEFEELVYDSPFFIDFQGRVEAGRRIGGGGQGGIYEVLFDGQVQWCYVLKVFETTCSSLGDLQRAWASEIRDHCVKWTQLFEWKMEGGFCYIKNGTLLEDGRFAFLMERYWGDLRKAIDDEVIKGSAYQKHPPFSLPMSLFLMLHIALGMKELHAHGIVHRDLKAANVLLFRDPQTIVSRHIPIKQCLVSDFECCEGVLGTGFWRAPEVLDAFKNRAEDIWSNPKIWTKKVDVYGYAMTCYEILTGCIPFQSRRLSDYDGVIGGERPPLPDYVDGEIQELLRKCWHHEPEMRPSFEEIEVELQGYIIKTKKFYEGLGEDEGHWVILFDKEYDWIQFCQKRLGVLAENFKSLSPEIRTPKSSHPPAQRRSNPSAKSDLGLNLPGLFCSDEKHVAEGRRFLLYIATRFQFNGDLS